MAGTGEVTIKIPRPLYERLQTVIAGTGFRSVTEFVVYVLRDLASSEVEATKSKKPKRPRRTEEELTAEEIEVIRRRLQDLGYL